MEAFDLAFVYLNRDPMTIDLLLLIKVCHSQHYPQ
jgi:hypothetical protein